MEMGDVSGRKGGYCFDPWRRQCRIRARGLDLFLTIIGSSWDL